MTLRRSSRALAATAIAVAVAAGLSSCVDHRLTAAPTHHGRHSSSPTATPSTAPTATATPTPKPTPKPSVAPRAANPYPWHTNIVSTTFWVGEVFDPNASDGSQVISTYDANWYANYGGCDGLIVNKVCSTEKRTAANGYFPTHMTPRQNPFYLDLPFDDINDAQGYATRGAVVPWAKSPAYAGSIHNPNVSLMKNRWVELTRGGATCYGQIEDAGPGQYHDAGYVFGRTNARPANARYGGAGLDVSPALNGCLRFAELDGDSDRLSWRFIDGGQVPGGPWLRLVTRTPLEE
jgi:hypothetical protein